MLECFMGLSKNDRFRAPQPLKTPRAYAPGSAETRLVLDAVRRGFDYGCLAAG